MIKRYDFFVLSLAERENEVFNNYDDFRYSLQVVTTFKLVYFVISYFLSPSRLAMVVFTGLEYIKHANMPLERRYIR